MTPPRRRSSRLRGSIATPAKPNAFANRLGSLAERDETPTSGPQSNLDAVLSSPIGPKTPATAGRIKPDLEEMHPSKVHPSTTEQPDSGLRLGFTDIITKGKNQPSGVGQQTPSKLGIGTPSSSFDFRFARPGTQLGPEAQRMMEELREEALKIKAKLVAEQEEEKRRNGGVDATGSRKIAQPKGKAGRYSDVHMAEFKKMDSIAGHPSAFRALPAVPATKSLKRTQSKAKLDDKDDCGKKAAGGSSSGRLENTAPAKRIRQHVTDDASSTRPISRDSNHPNKEVPSTPRSQSSAMATITTPTQASLARAASVKQPTSQIPTLSRSPSKPNLVSTPGGLKKSATIGNISSIPRSGSKSLLRSPSKFDRVKSILRHPGFTSKSIPSSVSSLPRSTTKPDLDKVFPPVPSSIPTTPGALHRTKSLKQMDFTPTTIDKNPNSMHHSPTPIKSGIPRSKSRVNLQQAAKPSSTFQSIGSSSSSNATEVEYPSISGLAEASDPVEYPSLDNVRSLSKGTPYPSKVQPPPPSVPGTFTFRSDKTISFGASPKGFGSSPGQASLRQVRPSMMPGTFPPSNKENSAPLPSVPHGMSNKKRRRADSDDEGPEDDERSPKKQKPRAAEGQMLMAPRIMAGNMDPPSAIPSPAKKKGLSLSRLNMLARPKMRK